MLCFFTQGLTADGPNIDFAQVMGGLSKSSGAVGGFAAQVDTTGTTAAVQTFAITLQAPKKRGWGCGGGGDGRGWGVGVGMGGGDGVWGWGWGGDWGMGGEIGG